MNYSNSHNPNSREVAVPLTAEQATCLIIQKAKQLVNRLIENRGNDRPPFLPAEFSRLQGIRKILEANLGNTSAVLLRFHDGYVIKVNKNHHPVRRNFSCAHEIGHTLFSELKLERYIRTIEYRTFNSHGEDIARAKARERLCDAAATELLMPESVFKKYLSGFGVSVNSIALLSNVFKASIPTVALRIEEVSTEPCVALQWKLWQRRKSKALRLSWSRKKMNCIPVHTKASPGSSLFKAFETDSVVKCHKLFKIGTAVKRLPMESKGFGYGENRRVYSLAFLER